MNGDTERDVGPGGAMRTFAALAVVLLGCVALGVVFDVIPRDMLSELATKIGLLVLVAAAVGGVLVVLWRRD